MVKFHFWFLKEKGKFLLKLLFASFSPRMIWFRLSELDSAFIWLCRSNFVKKIAIAVHVHSYETPNRVLAFAYDFLQINDLFDFPW